MMLPGRVLSFNSQTNSQMVWGGNRIALFSCDRRFFPFETPVEMQLNDSDTGAFIPTKRPLLFDNEHCVIEQLLFSPTDPSTLICAHRGAVCTWDLYSGGMHHLLAANHPPNTTLKPSEGSLCPLCLRTKENTRSRMCFSPDGQRLFGWCCEAALGNHEAIMWCVDTCRCALLWRRTLHFEFQPMIPLWHNNTVIVAHELGSAYVLDAATGDVSSRMEIQNQPLAAMFALNVQKFGLFNLSSSLYSNIR